MGIAPAAITTGKPAPGKAMPSNAATGKTRDARNAGHPGHPGRAAPRSRAARDTPGRAAKAGRAMATLQNKDGRASRDGPQGLNGTGRILGSGLSRQTLNRGGLPRLFVQLALASRP
ncbi:hypothetical protein PBS_32420 [Paraburkholderia sp. 2C]